MPRVPGPGGGQVSGFPDESTPQPPRPRPAPPSGFPDDPTDPLPAALRQGATASPDRAARVFALQGRTGFPPELIDRNLEEIEQRAAAADFDAAAFRQSYPKLTEWLAQHPQRAALAHDDLIPLSALERTIDVGRNVVGAAGAGVMGFSQGVWGLLQAGADTVGARDLAAFAGGSAATAEQLATRARGPQAHAGFVERGIYGGIESVGNYAPAIGLGFLLGPEATLGVIGGTTGGQEYSQAREQGAGVGRSLAVGTIQGAVEVATEMIPAHRLLGDVAARAPLFRTLLRQLTSESIGEEAATVLQDLNEWALLPANRDRPFSDYLAQRPSAAAATLISTITAVGAHTAVAEGAARVLEQLGAVARTSKTLQRSPDQVEQLVAGIAGDGPLATVHLPVDTFTEYFQSKGEDPAAVAARLTGQSDAYHVAQQTGADLAVPLARYVTQIAGTEHNAFFATEARFDPQAPNLREARAAGEALDREGAAATQAPEVSVAAPAIADAVTGMLDQAGVDPDTARLYGRLYEQTFATISARAGLDPVALFERYGLQVRREGLDPATPPQAPVAIGPEESVARDVPASEPVPGESPAQREQRRRGQYAELLAVVVRDARAVDPSVDAETVRAAFATRRDLYEASRAEARQSAADPIDLLRAIAAAGGLGPESYGGLTGELRKLKEGTRGGAANGVARVFRAKRTLDSRGQVVSGLAFDEMLDRLRTDPRFSAIETTDQLMGAIDAAMRGTSDRDVFPGTAELARALGIRRTEAWWRGVARRSEDVAGDTSTAVRQQYQQEKRGAIRFTRDAAGHIVNVDIQLLRTANLSTFLHETGHFYLELLADVADELGARDLATLTDAQRRVLADYGTLLQWLGVENRADITDAQHEQFAEAFEEYLREGRAPSVELRGAFQRFRAWLVNLYQSARSTRLSADVRAVMDRLLATDVAIDAAQQDAGVLPMLTDDAAIAAGVPREDVAQYRDLIQGAVKRARDGLQTTLLKQLQRERESWWKRERAAIREQLLPAFAARPVYRALALLQRGTLPDGAPLPPGVEAFKLSQDALVDQFGAEILARLPRPLVYAKTGGVLPSVAAELLGFRSGAALVNALATTPPIAEALDDAADARMRAEHGDLLLDGTVAAQAEQAMLDAGAEVFAAEAHALEQLVNRRTGSRASAPSVATLRDRAERRIAATPIGEIRPAVFAAAARRAGQRALEAAGRQDFRGALHAKLQQILNAELYRAAHQATELVETARGRFQAVFGRDTTLAKTSNLDLIQAARALLASFGLGPAQKVQTALEYLEQVKRYDPETYQDLSAAIAAAGLPAQPYRELTVDQFVGLRDAVLSLVHQARRSRQIVIEGQVHELAEVRGALEQRLRAITPPGRTAYHRARSTWEKTKVGLLGWRAALRRVESWVDAADAKDSRGVFRRFLFAPVSEAATRYRTARKATIERYLAIVQAVAPSLTTDEIAAPELSYTFSGKGELLHALLHIGNESNYRKLLLGDAETRPRWGDVHEDGSLDDARWRKFLHRMWAEGVVTKADHEYAQAVWDLNEELKPEAQRVFHDVYGYYFNEITAQPLETPFGTFRGGYVPAIYDSYLADDVAQRSDREALEQTPNSFMYPTTGRSFTYTRVEAYARPLALDLGLVPMHLDKVLRFIHLQPVIKDASRLVTHKGFREALRPIDETVAGELLVPWLQRAARQSVDTPLQGRGGQLADRVARKLRRRVALNIMTGNLGNALQQLTGISTALTKVPAPALARALWRYTRHPRVFADDVAERSAFMRDLTTTSVIEIQQHIDELLLNPSRYDQARAFAEKHGYFLSAATQNVVNLITWGGAYGRAVADGSTEAEAVAQADSAVRLTQGSYAPEDISKFEAGSPTSRALFMFFGYYNMRANLGQTEFQTAVRDLGLRKGAGRLFYVYLTAFSIPDMLSGLLVVAMAGGLSALAWGDDDDEHVLDAWLRFVFQTHLRGLTASIPGGSVVNALANTFATTNRYDDRISISPVVSAIEAMVRAPKEVYDAVVNQAPMKPAIRDALTLVGVATGTPAAAAGRPLGYLADVAQGKTTPTGPVDAARGLVSGQSPPAPR